jgi:hypothetical protein
VALAFAAARRQYESCISRIDFCRDRGAPSLGAAAGCGGPSDEVFFVARTGRLSTTERLGTQALPLLGRPPPRPFAPLPPWPRAWVVLGSTKPLARAISSTLASTRRRPACVALRRVGESACVSPTGRVRSASVVAQSLPWSRDRPRGREAISACDFASSVAASRHRVYGGGGLAQRQRQPRPGSPPRALPMDRPQRRQEFLGAHNDG